jgi:hypothetical protein
MRNSSSSPLLFECAGMEIGPAARCAIPTPIDGSNTRGELPQQSCWCRIKFMGYCVRDPRTSPPVWRLAGLSFLSASFTYVRALRQLWVDQFGGTHDRGTRRAVDGWACAVHAGEAQHSTDEATRR